MSNAPPSSTDNPSEPGSVLAGKYRVERVLGKGGMGVVIEARHIALDERVALKFLLPELAKHPEASRRFEREARAAVKIKSEHVARVSDVSVLADGTPYMVMEFLEGTDLSGALEEKGALAIPDAIDFVIQGCEAIAEAHGMGIVHRDIKPANLFLSKRPDGTPIVKVLDFGISKDRNNALDNLTRTTASMGSALYMSPEQMQATRSVDHRTDIYALGISLYELIAGKQPFLADTLPQLCAEVLTGYPTPLRSLRPDAPEALAEVIARAYARDRANRYQSVAELVVALAPFAPPRSQQCIERIARMGGLPIPPPATAGGGPASSAFSAPTPVSGAYPGPPFGAYPGGFAPRPPSDPSLSGPPSSGSPGFQPAPPVPPQQVQVAPGPPSGAWMPSAPPLPVIDSGHGSTPVPPPPSSHIVPGPYSAPMSMRAAANFAQHPTGSNLSRTGIDDALRHRQTNKIVALVISMLAIGSLCAGLVWHFVQGRRLERATATGGEASAVAPASSGAPAPGTASSTGAPAPEGSTSARPQDASSVGAPAAKPPEAPASAPAGHGKIPGGKAGVPVHVPSGPPSVGAAPAGKAKLDELNQSVYGR